MASSFSKPPIPSSNNNNQNRSKNIPPVPGNTASSASSGSFKADYQSNPYKGSSAQSTASKGVYPNTSEPTMHEDHGVFLNDLPNYDSNGNDINPNNDYQYSMLGPGSANQTNVTRTYDSKGRVRSVHYSKTFSFGSSDNQNNPTAENPNQAYSSDGSYNTAGAKADASTAAAGKVSHFRPGVVIGILSALIAATSIVCVPFAVISHSSPAYEEITATDSEELMPASSLLKAGEATSFKSGDSLVYTVPITKTDSNIYSYGAGAEVNLLNSDGEILDTDYLSIPQMDFFNDTVYVSGSFYDEDSGKIDIDLSDEDVYTTTLEEYTKYDFDDTDTPTDEERRQSALENGYITDHKFDVLFDGIADQSGVVIFKVSTDSIDADSNQYGAYNILFKKDGKVVYGDVEDYSFDTEDPSSFTISYSSEYDLPEYDEVEVIDLH